MNQAGTRDSKSAWQHYLHKELSVVSTVVVIQYSVLGQSVPIKVSAYKL